jgi:HK97 family phage prohead protease
MRPVIRAGVRHQRTYPLSIELRDMGEGSMPKMSGHAAVYNKWSEDLGGFKERVLPGAFDKSIGVSDVRALFNHDPNYIFARTSVSAGTEGALSLSSETKGLHIEAMPLDTATIRDLVIAPCRAGLVTQMSFSFMVRGDEGWDCELMAGMGAVWRSPKQMDGLYERDLLDLELFDVSPVTFPAYPQTDVAVRALLSKTGIDLDALTACLARSERGLPLLDNDIELITSSIAVLRTVLPPEANGEEPSGANPEDGSRSDEERPSRARLLRELDHRLRIDQIAIGRVA